MRVLILGCGYIGCAAAAALRRAGHDVVGVIRQGNVQLRRKLEAVEVEVLEADARTVSTYQSAIQAADVVIDCLSQADRVATSGNQARAVDILDAVAKIAKETKKTRRYIWTNGVMTYGNHDGRLVDETTEPNGVNAWKAQYAASFLARNNPAEFLETIDVRPGWVYGEDFGHYVDWFAIGANEPIKAVGPIDKKWPWIHVYDCAAAFVTIVEAPGSVVGGQVFNITDDTNVPNVEIQKAFARAAGRKDELVVNHSPKSEFEFMNYSLLVSSAKLQKATGWKPKCGPMLGGNENRLFRAWKAAKGQSE